MWKLINEKWDAKPAQSYFNLLYVSTFITFRDISWVNLVSIWGTPIPSSSLVGFRSVWFDLLWLSVSVRDLQSPSDGMPVLRTIKSGYSHQQCGCVGICILGSLGASASSWSYPATLRLIIVIWCYLDRIHTCFQTFQPHVFRLWPFFFWVLFVGSWSHEPLWFWWDGRWAYSYILWIHFLLDPCWGNIWCFLGILEILERRGTADFLHSSFEHGPVFGYSQCL